MLERFWPLRRLNASNDKLWIGRDQETQEEVVMKLIEVSDDEIKNQQVKMEAHALKMFSDMDPFRIVGFRSFYVNTERQFVICMEMGKCSLAESLAFRPVLTEEEARTIVRCILEALVTVHSKRFVHRDVKPENLILFSDELDSLKLGDFGICDEDNGYNSCGGIKGTKGYMAPEILKKEQYGRAVDIWSTGCVAFQLVYGRLPFVSPIKTSILGSKPKLVFPDMYPVSEQGKAFIAALLQENPDMRPTAAEALEHPWLSGAPLATQHPNTLQIPHSQSFSQSSSYNYPPPQSLTVPAPRTPSPKGIFPLGRQTPSPVAQFASLAPAQTGLFAAKRQTPSPAPAIPPQSEFPERHFFPYSAPGAPPGSKYAAPIPTMRVSTDSDEEEEIPLESRRKNASTQSRNSAPEASISRDFQIDVGGLVGAKTPVPAPSPAPASPAPAAANKVNEKLVRFNDDITVGYSLGDGDGSDVSPVGDAIELPQNSPPSRWLEDDELARTVSTKVQVSFGGSEDSQKYTAAGNPGQYESFDISDDQSNQFFQSPLDGADGWNCVIVPKDTVFFYNAKTGVSQWNSPLEKIVQSRSVPPPPAPPQKDSMAKRLGAESSPTKKALDKQKPVPPARGSTTTKPVAVPKKTNSMSTSASKVATTPPKSRSSTVTAPPSTSLKVPASGSPRTSPKSSPKLGAEASPDSSRRLSSLSASGAAVGGKPR